MARKSEKDKKIEALEAELATYRAKDRAFISCQKTSTKKKLIIASSLILFLVIFTSIIVYLSYIALSIPKVKEDDWQRTLSLVDKVTWTVDKENSKKLNTVLSGNFYQEIKTISSSKSFSLVFSGPSNQIRLPLTYNGGEIIGESRGKTFKAYLTESTTGKAKALILISGENKIILEPSL